MQPSPTIPFSPANDLSRQLAEFRTIILSIADQLRGQSLSEGRQDADHRHGPDFRSVLWNGTHYHFSAYQAAIVAVLWQAWENKTPDVGQDTLLESAGSEGSRVQLLFRLAAHLRGKATYHPAWGTLIVRGVAKGTFRLAD